MIQRRWLKLELALVLAEATGRRLGSIRELLWKGVDWNEGTIRCRGETDKKGVELVIPVAAPLLGELSVFRQSLGAMDGLMFPSEKNSAVAMDRHLFDKWLSAAERRAGLPKLDGGLWHAYRRKWATERKHLPLNDVAAAGGWSDVVDVDRLAGDMTDRGVVRDVAANDGHWKRLYRSMSSRA